MTNKVKEKVKIFKILMNVLNILQIYSSNLAEIFTEFHQKSKNIRIVFGKEQTIKIQTDFISSVNQESPPDF